MLCCRFFTFRKYEMYFNSLNAAAAIQDQLILIFIILSEDKILNRKMVIKLKFSLVLFSFCALYYQKPQSVCFSGFSLNSMNCWTLSIPLTLFIFQFEAKLTLYTTIVLENLLQVWNINGKQTCQKWIEHQFVITESGKESKKLHCSFDHFQEATFHLPLGQCFSKIT